MKETISGGLLLLAFILILSLFSGSVTPDLSRDEPQQEGSVGHPLWTN